MTITTYAKRGAPDDGRYAVSETLGGVEYAPIFVEAPSISAALGAAIPPCRVLAHRIWRQIEPGIWCQIEDPSSQTPGDVEEFVWEMTA